MKKVIFPNSKIVGKRDWGQEYLLVLIPKILSLKKIFIKKGKKGGLQYHHKKNECGYLVNGKLLIRFDNGKGKLISKIIKKGECFHFPPGAVHQEQALTNCTIIEASTPYFNDRVRVEDNYGIRKVGGLPTTTKRQVRLK
jgi:mannose-6-phosphate isomerase